MTVYVLEVVVFRGALHRGQSQLAPGVCRQVALLVRQLGASLHKLVGAGNGQVWSLTDFNFVCVLKNHGFEANKCPLIRVHFFLNNSFWSYLSPSLGTLTDFLS